MRILTAALICFIIASASYSATVESIIFGSSGLPNYSLILILLSTYLMLEGIYSIELDRQQQSASRRDDARKHLRSYEPQKEPTVEADNSEELEDLKLALRDSEEKLRTIRREAQSAGNNVDAELVNFLGVLQEQGRFVDFLMDDISGYDDSQVGAAARVVHQGCKEVLEQYFSVAPVYDGEEGEQTSLNSDFNTSHYRLVGTAAGEPPYSGTVVHKGWRTTKVSVPKVSNTGTSREQWEVIAPAQVDVA